MESIKKYFIRFYTIKRKSLQYTPIVYTHHIDCIKYPQYV